MRHLTPAQAEFALRRGQQIEQYLGRQADSADPLVRWLTAHEIAGRFQLILHEVRAPLDANLLDLAELEPVDPDEHLGEGRRVGEADSWEDLSMLAAQFGGQNEQWVNQGLVASEFADDIGGR